MELLSHTVVLLLVFWATFRLFSTVVALIYIFTNSSWAFHFLHILTICCLRSFHDSHSTMCEVVYLIVVLTFISLMINSVKHLFMWQWPSVCLLWKNVYSGLLLIFNFFLMLTCMNCLYAFYINPYQSYHLQIISSIQEFTFLFYWLFPL